MLVDREKEIREKMKLRAEREEERKKHQETQTALIQPKDSEKPKEEIKS